MFEVLKQSTWDKIYLSHFLYDYENIFEVGTFKQY